MTDVSAEGRGLPAGPPGFMAAETRICIFRRPDSSYFTLTGPGPVLSLLKPPSTESKVENMQKTPLMAPPICPSCSGSQRGTPLCSCKHCRPQLHADRQNAQKSAPAEGAETRSCLLPVTSSLWQSNIRGNWVEAPLEGETGALN